METSHPENEGPSTGVNSWGTRVFQIPDFFAIEWLSGGRIRASASPSGASSKRRRSSGGAAGFPAIPDENAPAAAWHHVITRCTALISRWLGKLGLDTPEGSIFLYDACSATLVARSTEAYLELLEPVLAAFIRKAPQMLTFGLEVLEASAALTRWSLAQTQDRKDHTDVFSQMLALVDTGTVKVVRQIRLETRPGQRAVSEFDYDGVGELPPTGSPFSRGIRLAVEADVDPAEMDIAVKLDFSFQGNCEQSQGIVGEKDRHAHLVTTTVMGSGTTRLIAVWEPSRGHPGQMLAAYLRGDMVPLLPLGNARLAGMVDRHAAAFPARAGMVRLATFASSRSSMEVRLIKVKPEFLTRTGATPEAVAEALRREGVSFPEGSRMEHIPAVSMMVAKNTPRNLESIQQLMERAGGSRSRTANLTLEIVEGDAAVLRGMMERSRSVADHRVVWSEVESLAAQGSMRLLRTARLEVRHGEKGWFSAGEARAGTVQAAAELLSEPTTRGITNGVRSGLVAGNGHGNGSGNRNGNGHSSGNGAPAHGKLNGAHTSKFAAPVRLIGTWLEVAPVISGPNMEVDLEIEHHYAPLVDPRVKNGDAETGIGVRREGDERLVAHRRFRCRSSISARSGMVRLVGVWAPEGHTNVRESGGSVLQAAFLRMDLAWAQAEQRS